MRKTLAISCLIVSGIGFADSDEHTQGQSTFNWPGQYKAAVSLSYDDALNSQLDNVIPALNRYGFNATFFLTLSSPTLKTRLPDWRAAARQGHELGNHTINHGCRASLPGKEWVAPENDLDQKSIAEISQEVKNANTFLHAIDGEQMRTFTPPCIDIMVKDGNYLPAVSEQFVGIKMLAAPPVTMQNFKPLNTPTWFPSGVSGEALINYVSDAARKGTLASITFHGVGGDHLQVSNQAHNELLEYLDKHRETYWVDTFLNISQHIQTQQK